jgi:FixJ family two-component response regulator
MSKDSPWVFLVDDDPSVRKALTRLIQSAGFMAMSFACADEFLDHERPDAPSCLILDLQLPGCSGLDLQEKLHQDHVLLPVIFVTGHGDIPLTVRAMKAGAIDFLSKPFDESDLLSAVRQAIARDTAQRAERLDVSRIQKRIDSLSPREKEVLAHVVSGQLNKQIAHDLGITEKTIKVHRGQVMRKMGVASLAELVRMAERVGILGPAVSTATG